MANDPGLRVVRGPDWEWKDQDGGEGHVGTVSSKGDVEGSVIVQWDGEGRAKYRCGVGDKYDLRVVDSGPAGELHKNLTCSWCDDTPMVGTLWKCVCCLEYYLCMTCYMADKHSIRHPFEYCQASDLKNRVRVPPRFLSHKQPMYGLFPEATVVRGQDWKWGNQDGGNGNKGHIIKIGNWKDETFHSVAVVSWTHAPSHNVYRRGHHGMMDIRCVAHSCGGTYYPDHLPVLGKEFMLHVDSPEISAGDSVMVTMDPDMFKLAQQDYGGWDDSMAEAIGEVGRVNSILCNDRMMVFYPSNRRYMINGIALQKVELPFFEFGDAVQIAEDLVEMHKLQKNYGEWADEMSDSLGQVGRVVNHQRNTLRVAVKGKRWTFNPKCVAPAKEETTNEEDENDVYIPQNTRLGILSLLHSSSPEVVIHAAEVGDAGTLAMYLKQNPKQVNYNEDGKGGMFHAIKENYKHVVRVFLDHGADVNYRGEDGQSFLHHCAIMGNYEIAEMLVKAGADVNLTDWRSWTPVGVAAYLGFWRVLKVLVADPAANLNCQTSEGNTPLHQASVHQHWACSRLLLENGADLNRYNFDMVTPLHRICQTGFLAGLEQMIRYHPEHINLRKDDDFTPLHMAAINNHVDLVAFLVTHPSCNINAQSKDKLTALLLAAYEGHVSIVEILVGYGVDLNLTSPDGSSVLHVVLGKDNMEDPDENSPRIRKFKTEFEVSHGEGLLSMGTIAALFLAANGADIKLKNLLGKTPINCVSSDVRELLHSYSGNRDSYHGSLKLKTQTFTDPPRPIKQHSLVAPTASGNGYSSALSGSQDNPHLDASGPGREGEAVKGMENFYANSKDEGTKLTPTENKNFQQYTETVNTSKETNTAPVTMPLRATTAPAPLSSTLPVSASPPPPPSPLSDEDCCLLCDERCDVVFLPCGHMSLCHKCCLAAKKCSTCRKKVTECLVVCVLCHAQNCPESSFPCGHRFCSGCTGHQCRVCKQEP